MDIVLQAAIGLLVAVAVVWVLIVKRKAKGIGTLVYGGVLSAVCVTALVFGLIRQFSGGSDTETLDKEDMLAFGSTLAKYGAYEQAEDIIDDYSRLYGYDDDCSLLMARIYALQGAYDKAENIYNRFAEDDDYAEVIKAERQALSQLYDTDGTEQEASSGDNVASEDESADDQSSNAVTQAVVAAIDKLSKGTDFDTYAKLVIDSVKAFEQYSGTSIDSLSEEEQAAIKALRSSIVKMRNECNGAFNTAAVREAFLRLNLFAKDYKAIAEVIDDKATYDELVIASELYLNGVITGADFSSDYAQEYKDNALEVGQHLSDSYADIKEDVSSTEAAELKSTLESWNAQIMHPQLTEMKNTMTSLVDNDETGNDSSKVNLQIAKVEHYLEDEVKRDEHIYDAIIESVDSDDEEYSQPMGQILQIINNTGSSEGITEVPGYVAKALQNALPTDMESYVPEGTIDNTTNQSGGTGTDIESVKEFSQAVSECVSKIKSTISIGKINTDDFEEISASVIISSDYANSSEELKNIISVYDCGIEIKDFTIEKVNYSSVKTILICDVSGSMSGSISDLRNAVSTYVNSRNSKESISIVTFNDGVTGRVDFGASDQQLLEFAAGMGAGGGTAIYNTLYSTLENFNTSANCNNVIIVMTDGCDGSARNSETIKNELGALVDAKGVTVYTLGLGSVDTAYLNAIADAGNGSFVYASDSVSLGAFYDLLQGQVDNQYIIKYKAVDTMTQTGRTLEVKIDSENLSDLKYYSLTGDDSEGGDGSNTVDGLQPDQISVNGLSVRKAYRGSDDIENTLIGSGFSKDSTATLKLNGNIDYDISLTYVDENTYSLKIPSSVAVGTYNVEVTIDGKKCVLKNGFTMCVAGSEKTTAFGPYVFTSMNKTVNGQTITLSGDVTMNGWLTFKGDVILSGDIDNGSSISVKDESGSYVMFDKDTAEGLGAYFAEKNIAFDIPALGKFTLYNDMSNRLDYDNYNVDAIRTSLLKVYQVIQIQSPYIRLYPHQITMEFNQSTTVLPFQDVVFNAADIDMPFSIDVASSATVSDKNLGIKIEFDGEDERENYRQFTMFNAPVYLDMNKLKISIDTMENEYTFGGMVKVAFLDFGLGAEVTLKGFTPDKFSLTLDKDKNTVIGGVPITFGNFTLGAEDIADALESKDFRKLIIVGKFDVSAAKASAFFPSLKKYVGDVSLFSLPETEFKLDLQPLSLSANATLKFLDEITLAKAEIQFGTFNYTNELLDLDDCEVSGVRAALSTGLEWDIANCDVSIMGTGELDVLSRFMGVQYDGNVDIDIKWWIFSTNIDKDAKVLLGVYFTESGDPQFTLALEYEGLFGKNKRLYYYIDKNGNTGDKNGSL